jgi:hypothetical protein
MKIIRTLCCAVAALSLAPAAHAARIYGATAAGDPGRLYVIDSATGGVLENVGPLNDVAGLNYGITGLAFHPVTGVLYGSTHNLATAAPQTLARLVTIDPVTARVTMVGEFNAGNPSARETTMGDIAFDAAGNLYGVGTIDGPQLYSINIANGQAAIIGNTGLTSTTGGGLAISPTGVFYGTPTASRFGTYDVASGAYTNIGNPEKPAGGGYGALAFGADGVLYGLNVGTGAPPPTHLVIINPATAAVTDIGVSVTSLDAIAVQIPEPAGVLLLLVPAAVLLARRGLPSRSRS